MKSKDVFLKLKESNLDGLVVTNTKNILYLIGIEPQERLDWSIFLYEGDIHVVTSSMFEEEIRKSKIKSPNNFILHLTSKNLKLTDVIEGITGTKVNIGFESNDIKYSEFQKLSKIFGRRLSPTTDIIESLRSVKTTKEIELIRNACKITAKVIDEVGSEIKYTDYSESDIVEIIKNKLYNNNSVEAFSSIVAMGANSSVPHHKPTNLKQNVNSTPILIDIGAKIDFYSGDMTRTFYFGEDTDIVKIHKIVNDCKNYVINNVRPGLSFNDLHKLAMKFFKKHNLERNFIHGIGHGIGLSIHEVPFASSKEKLVSGNVITIEPGLYFPGKFGIRDEDVILVTKTGCEILTSI